MTAQEQQLLQGLIDRVSRTPLSEKDSDAENLLQGTLGKNPDALYILAQTVLVQQYALEQAQKQLKDAQQQVADLSSENEQLRQQPPAPQKHTSFLGSLLGRDDDAPRTAPPPPPPPASQYTPVPTYPQQVYPTQQGGFGQPAGYGSNFGAPQGGGFLRSALQTATGVAAGAIAFQGIESLMHGFGHAAGYGGEFGPAFGGGFGQSQPREEIINNYYGDSRPGSDDHGGNSLPDFNDKGGNDSSWSSNSTTSHEGSRDLSSADGTSDMGRDFGDSSGRDFASTSDNSGNDSSAFDSDSNNDATAGFDDGGGFDDSGSGFDSGADSGGGFDDSSSGNDGF